MALQDLCTADSDHGIYEDAVKAKDPLESVVWMLRLHPNYLPVSVCTPWLFLPALDDMIPKRLSNLRLRLGLALVLRFLEVSVLSSVYYCRTFGVASVRNVLDLSTDFRPTSPTGSETNDLT